MKKSKLRFLALLGLAIAIAILSIVQSIEVAALFIGGIFFVQLMTFIVSFYAYERRGDA